MFSKKFKLQLEKSAIASRNCDAACWEVGSGSRSVSNATCNLRGLVLTSRAKPKALPLTSFDSFHIAALSFQPFSAFLCDDAMQDQAESAVASGAMGFLSLTSIVILWQCPETSFCRIRRVRPSFSSLQAPMAGPCRAHGTTWYLPDPSASEACWVETVWRSAVGSGASFSCNLRCLRHISLQDVWSFTAKVSESPADSVLQGKVPFCVTICRLQLNQHWWWRLCRFTFILQYILFFIFKTRALFLFDILNCEAGSQNDPPGQILWQNGAPILMSWANLAWSAKLARSTSLGVLVHNRPSTT